jgi:hypothetical protein
MEFIRPQHPPDLVDRVSRDYPVNCLGCEHLRALPDKTALCTFGGSPRKVDVLAPLRTNRKCKYAEEPDPSGKPA